MGNEAAIETSIRAAVDFADLLIIDTCSWLDEHGPLSEPTHSILLKTLSTRGKHVAVPLEVFGELRKIRDDPERDATLQARAKEAYRQIKTTHRASGRARLFVVYSDGKTKGHADARLLALFEMYYTTHKIVVVTQDRALGADLLARSQTRSVRHKPALILYIHKDGTWQDCSPPFMTGLRVKVSTLSTKTRPLRPEDAAQPLRTASGRPVMLGERLGRGGEGVVYAAGMGLAAKLYHAMSPMREGKLRRMVENPPRDLGHLAYPTDLLLDGQGQVVGVLMPRAKGMSLCDVLRLDNVTLRPAILGTYPHFRRHHLAEIALAVARRVQTLHTHGVILGDINEENVLVEPPADANGKAEAWLVDVDSAQVEGYPCLVGKPEFAVPWAPSASQGFQRLRSKDEDGFALAVLLFFILMARVMPYQCCGKTYDQAAQEGCFPYANPKTRRKLLETLLYQQFVWGGLTVELRGRFCSVFDKDGHWFKQSKAPFASAWTPLLEEYREAILARPTEDAFGFGEREPKQCASCGLCFMPRQWQEEQCPVCRPKWRVCDNCGETCETTWEGEQFYCRSCRSKHDAKPAAIEPLPNPPTEATPGQLSEGINRTGQYNPDHNPITD